MLRMSATCTRRRFRGHRGLFRGPTQSHKNSAVCIRVVSPEGNRVENCSREASRWCLGTQCSNTKSGSRPSNKCDSSKYLTKEWLGPPTRVQCKASSQGKVHASGLWMSPKRTRVGRCGKRAIHSGLGSMYRKLATPRNSFNPKKGSIRGACLVVPSLSNPGNHAGMLRDGGDDIKVNRSSLTSCSPCRRRMARCTKRIGSSVWATTPNKSCVMSSGCGHNDSSTKWCHNQAALWTFNSFGTSVCSHCRNCLFMSPAPRIQSTQDVCSA